MSLDTRATTPFINFSSFSRWPAIIKSLYLRLEHASAEVAGKTLSGLTGIMIRATHHLIIQARRYQAAFSLVRYRLFSCKQQLHTSLSGGQSPLSDFYPGEARTSLAQWDLRITEYPKLESTNRNHQAQLLINFPVRQGRTCDSPCCCQRCNWGAIYISPAIKTYLSPLLWKQRVENCTSSCDQMLVQHKATETALLGFHL